MNRKPLVILGAVSISLFLGRTLLAQEGRNPAVEPSPAVTLIDKKIEGEEGKNLVRKSVVFTTARATYPNGICIAYTNHPCAEPHWIQFIWIECTDKEGKDVTIGGSPLEKKNGANVHIPFSEPGDPKWVVDSPHTDDAYYDHGAATSPDGNSMYDAPSAKKSESWDHPTGPKSKLIKHYRAFKICDGKVVHSWTWSATFTGGPGGAGPEYNAEDGTDNKLDPAQKEAIKNFPQATLFQ